MEDRRGYSGIGVSDGYEMPRGFGELNPDPLEEQPELISEPSLQLCLSWLVRTGSHYLVRTGPERGVLPRVPTLFAF